MTLYILIFGRPAESANESVSRDAQLLRVLTDSYGGATLLPDAVGAYHEIHGMAHDTVVEASSAVLITCCSSPVDIAVCAIKAIYDQRTVMVVKLGSEVTFEDGRQCSSSCPTGHCGA